MQGTASLRKERKYHRVCQLVRGLQICEVILRTTVPRCGSLSGDELGRGQQKEQREESTVKTQTLPGTGCSFNVFLSVSLCWLLWLSRKCNTHSPEKVFLQRKRFSRESASGQKLNYTAPTDWLPLSLDHLPLWTLKHQASEKMSLLSWAWLPNVYFLDSIY